MPEEKEENLITIFKNIRDDIEKMRESTETTMYIINNTSEKMQQITLNTVYDMYTQLNEMRKVLQWYAENQTGKKYMET